VPHRHYWALWSTDVHQVWHTAAPDTEIICVLISCCVVFIAHVGPSLNAPSLFGIRDYDNTPHHRVATICVLCCVSLHYIASKWNFNPRTNRPHHTLHFSRLVQQPQHWPMTLSHRPHSGRSTCQTSAVCESQLGPALFLMAGRQRPQVSQAVSSILRVLYHYTNSICSADSTYLPVSFIKCRIFRQEHQNGLKKSGTAITLHCNFNFYFNCYYWLLLALGSLMFYVFGCVWQPSINEHDDDPITMRGQMVQWPTGNITQRYSHRGGLGMHFWWGQDWGMHPPLVPRSEFDIRPNLTRSC